MKKLNVKSETLIGVGLGLLTVAQLVLSNKKEAAATANLKKEIIEEVTKDLSNK